MVKDAIDLGAAIIHSSPDVRSWPATVRITVIDETPAGGFAFAFDREIPESWKWPSNPADPSENFQYTVWAGLKIGDVWHLAGFVQMWQGRAMGGRSRALPPLFQDVDGVPGYKDWWGDPRGLWGEMSVVVPRSGDVLAFMVSAGNGRLTGGVSSVAERSNVVLFRIVDTDDTGVSYAADGPIEPPPVVVPPPVNVPPSEGTADVAQLWTAIADMERRQASRHLELMAAIAAFAPPIYDGTVQVPYIGKGAVTLTPRPK